MRRAWTAGGRQKRKTRRDKLRKLSSYLRTGAIDEVLAAFIGLHQWREFRTVEDLLRYVEDHRRWRRGLSPFARLRAPAFLRRFVRTRKSNEPPNEGILELLAELGLEEQLGAYSSRFFGSFPESIAGAFDRLQAYFPALPAELPNRDLWWNLRAGPAFNFFRLAQRIRNEHGVTRGTSAANCFCSYEDIVESERELGNGNAIGLMMQCDALDLLKNEHIISMYWNTSSFSQLEKFHDAARVVGGKSSFWRGPIGLYREQFRKLIEEGLDPEWRELKTYLKTSANIKWDATYILPRIGSGILVGNADEALNCLLNRLAMECSDPGCLTDTVLLLLKNGANVYFRDVAEEQSTLVALIISCISCMETQLSLASPYICCPIRPHGWELEFDGCRVPWLSCLVARKVFWGNDSIAKLPLRLRAFVEAHRDLVSRFGRS